MNLTSIDIAAGPFRMAFLTISSANDLALGLVDGFAREVDGDSLIELP
jgi:hypothetical protein